jgi:hypothetical protein
MLIKDVYIFQKQSGGANDAKDFCFCFCFLFDEMVPSCHSINFHKKKF